MDPSAVTWSAVFGTSLFAKTASYLLRRILSHLCSRAGIVRRHCVAWSDEGVESERWRNMSHGYHWYQCTAANASKISRTKRAHLLVTTPILYVFLCCNILKMHLFGLHDLQKICQAIETDQLWELILEQVDLMHQDWFYRLFQLSPLSPRCPTFSICWG